MSASEETPKTVPHESSDCDDNKAPGQQAQSSPTAAAATAADAQSRPTSRDSDKSSEATFEDALETGSVRSLTKRQHPAVKRQSSEEPTIQEKEDEAPKPAVAANGAPEEQEKPADTTVKNTPRRLSQDSAGELDNVNLDDDDTTTTSATAATAATAATSSTTTTSSTAATAATTSTTVTSSSTTPPESEKSPPHKPKMSLSSIASAFPPMPWSPNPDKDKDTHTKTPPAATQTAPTPAPAPATTRKFTFSWLSRGSKEKEQPKEPLAPSPRRNTTSSVATLSSNPELMLSKLGEEKEGDASSRNSLKDRFKLLRMREEAAPGEEDKAAAADGADVSPSLTSPLPTSPNPNLAPGTASGVTAGPSAITNSTVDWDLWQAVVYEGPAAVARTSPEELNKAIATGIPTVIRGVIWQVLAQSKNEELEAIYWELVARGTDKEKKAKQSKSGSSASSVHSDSSGPNGSMNEKESAAAEAERKKKEKEDLAAIQKLEKIIRRDLGARTSYSKFAAAQGLQEGLFNVCKAYALFDEGVGYAQGMNFIVMPLLFNMPEEEAFCLLVRLMNHYHLRDLFIHDMPGLHLRLYQFERLLEDFEPALYCHLRRRGISPHLYATQWFLTLFAYRFPLQLVLRIYDLILSEGLAAILKFGVVLMQKNAANLLGITDVSQLTTFLRDRLFDYYIDPTPSSHSILENGFFGSSSSSIDKEVYRADELVRDACEIKITPEMLKAYQAEWEEKMRAEREREAEIESLRAQNASYAIRLRKLEERLQQVDAEQASLATELVHTKVENNELKDENESLRIQVQELKIVIEKQPEELEAQWKLERDDLMKRNAAVCEENRRLEAELEDLGKQLVEAKMQYAEINSAHETLTRKWTDLKRQFQ